MSWIAKVLGANKTPESQASRPAQRAHSSVDEGVVDRRSQDALACGENVRDPPRPRRRLDKSSQTVTDLVDRGKREAAWSLIRERVKGGARIDDIRDTRYAGEPPIWVRLLESGDVAVARFAILSGADANAQNCIGRTALSLAAEQGLQEIVALLIANGADPNAPCRGHDSPLSAAARKGHAGVVETLLAANADVHSTNEFGHTPLMAAAGCGDEAIIRRLVSAGASATALDRFGRTAMYYAADNKRTAAMAYLATLGARSVDG